MLVYVDLFLESLILFHCQFVCSLANFILPSLLLVSCVLFFVTPWTVALQAPCPWDSPGRNTEVGCHSLLQEIFPTQGLNPGLLHCRQILYLPRHQGRSLLQLYSISWGFPAGSNGKEFVCNMGSAEMQLYLGSGSSPGEGNGYPLQSSCLPEKPHGQRSL